MKHEPTRCFVPRRKPCSFNHRQLLQVCRIGHNPLQLSREIRVRTLCNQEVDARSVSEVAKLPAARL